MQSYNLGVLDFQRHPSSHPLFWLCQMGHLAALAERERGRVHHISGRGGGETVLVRQHDLSHYLLSTNSKYRSTSSATPICTRTRAEVIEFLPPSTQTHKTPKNKKTVPCTCQTSGVLYCYGYSSYTNQFHRKKSEYADSHTKFPTFSSVLLFSDYSSDITSDFTDGSINRKQKNRNTEYALRERRSFVGAFRFKGLVSQSAS